MARKKKTGIIARHEFNSIVKRKTFLIITILGPFLIFAVTVLPMLLSDGSDQIEAGTRIALTGSTSALAAPLEAALGSQGITLIVSDDREALETELVEEGSLQGIIDIPGDIMKVDSFTYYSKSGTDYLYSQMIRGIVGEIVLARRLAEAGFDQKEYQSLSRTPGVDVKKLSRSGVAESQDIGTVIITSISFIMLLYMSTLLYGQMIGHSVVVEKTSKTVEVLLSSARPSEIMAGKIIGIGCAGLLQYAIWISAALLIRSVMAEGFASAILSSFSLSTLLLLLLFFIAAFSLYASLYAALGAAAENEQNLGQLAWPLIIFLVIPMVMISNLVLNPNSVLTIALSYFPLTSPMVMFVRVLVEMPQLWELVLCFAILILSIAGILWFSSRIFRVGILMTGKKVTIKEMLRWVRYR